MIMFFTPGCNTCMLDNHWGKHWDCCEGNVLNVFLYFCVTFFVYLWDLFLESELWVLSVDLSLLPRPIFPLLWPGWPPFHQCVYCTVYFIMCFYGNMLFVFFVSVCAYQYLKCNIQHTVCLCTTQCACVHQYGHPFISTISPAPPPPISHFIFL